MKGRTIRLGAALCLTLAVAACGSDDDDDDDGTSGDGGNPNPGWTAAVGDDGTLVQTFDDSLWEVRRVADADLHAVACVGNRYGWAAGSDGAVLATTDSGETWSALEPGLSGTIRSVRFASPQPHSQGTDPARFVGVVVDDTGWASITRDGGASWQPEQLSEQPLAAAALSHRADLMLAVGGAGSVFRSTDHGLGWSSVTIEGATGLTAISTNEAGRVVLVSDDSGGIWFSSDGGASFVADHRADGALRSVALSPDGTRALAAGVNGQLLVRDQNGSWSRVDAGTSATLESVLVSHDGTRYYAAGERGTLLTSTDWGATWQRRTTTTEVTLRGLEDLAPY